MGKVKTEQIKRVANELVARFPEKFSNNFEENKRAVDALTRGTTTKVRNQIAGYITSSCAPEDAASNEDTEAEDTSLEA